MNAIRLAFVVSGLATGTAGTALAQDRMATKWEYKILTKDQIVEQGKNDLTAGLNKLGNEGWELVLLDGGYVFKRPQSQLTRQVSDLKVAIKFIEGDVEMLKERVSWAERMQAQGFMSPQTVNNDRSRLRRAEAALEKAKAELESLSPTAPTPAPMEKGAPPVLPKPQK